MLLGTFPFEFPCGCMFSILLRSRRLGIESWDHRGTPCLTPFIFAVNSKTLMSFCVNTRTCFSLLNPWVVVHCVTRPTPCGWTIGSDPDPFPKGLRVISILSRHKQYHRGHPCPLWNVSVDHLPDRGEPRASSVFSSRFWPVSDPVALFRRGPTRHHGTEGPA